MMNYFYIDTNKILNIRNEIFVKQNVNAPKWYFTKVLWEQSLKSRMWSQSSCVLECNCRAKERSYQRFPLEEERTSFLFWTDKCFGLFVLKRGSKRRWQNMRGLHEVCLRRLVEKSSWSFELWRTFSWVITLNPGKTTKVLLQQILNYWHLLKVNSS